MSRDLVRSADVADPLVEPIIRALRSRTAFAEVAAVARERAAKDVTFNPEVPFAVIGDYDRFFDALEARIAHQDTARFAGWTPWAWRFATAGDAASLRFKKFAKLAGFVDYWKKHGWPDKCRPQGADDFVCD